MFTGIIKELGTVREFARHGGMRRLTIESSAIADSVKVGDSVAVNGACLTATKIAGGRIFFDILEETMRKSSFFGLKINDRVNLEDALKAGEPLGGHFVQGHVDCVGSIKRIEKNADSYSLTFSIPERFGDLVVDKGSVAIDGVSLTVGDRSSGTFTVYIIPHTLKCTALAFKRTGDPVNIEFDILGKYITRHLSQSAPKITVTEEFLKEKGFI